MEHGTNDYRINCDIYHRDRLLVTLQYPGRIKYLSIDLSTIAETGKNNASHSERCDKS